MSEATTRLALPFIAAGQAQKHVTYNDALVALDALVQLGVAGRRAAPPTPVEGERYIVDAAPTGAFAGRAGAIAFVQDGAWRYATPRTGWRAWIEEEDRLCVFRDGAWTPAPQRETDRLGIATTADATNRLAVASPAGLFTHAGSDMRLKVNKASAANTASLLFQTGLSGRAEMGLAGNDAFSVKLSADGAAWRESARFDPAAISLSGRRDDLGSTVSFHVAKQTGAVGVSVDVVSSNGTTLADFALQTELHTVTFRNEGRAGSCISGSAPEFQVRFPPPFATSPLAIGPDLVISNAPHRLRSYPTTALPAPAAAGAGALIFVSNAAGGAVPAFSDGSAWRSVVDRAVVA
jgi:hypothetical protein